MSHRNEGMSEMTSSGVVERVNPGDLEVAANVRREVELTKEFVASVKQHGVLVPIIVEPGAERYQVVDGQRRTLAAVDAGLESVPVVVIDPIVTTSERIVDQLVVNGQRAGLTVVDQVAAVKELALFGMSATAIAKKIGAKKADVDTAIAVGGSDAASAAMREHQVSLEDAALIAEFQDDPDALAELTEHAAKGWSITHLAQQHRDRREAAVVAAQIEAMEGVTLIERPSYDQSDPIPVSDLYLDAELKEPLTDDRVAEFAGDGLCAYPTSSWEDGGRVWSVGYAIKGWKELGLHAPSWRANRGPSKPSTPEEAEALKAERRQARENTKAWVSATAVRFGWLQELLARKTMPKGRELVVARHLVAVHASGYSSTQWKHVITLLQVTHDSDSHSYRDTVAKYLESHPTRAAAVAIAGAIGSIEGGFEFERKGWSQSATKAYLELLAGWGYELSEIEQLVVKGRTTR